MTRTALAIALLGVLLTLAGPAWALAPATAAEEWRWPVAGELVTHYRNGDDPYAGGQHRGIDVAAPAGREVTAATAGTVTFAGTVGSSGSTVSIRTADGRFDTSYLHLGSIDVEEGDAVETGTRIGTVGASGGGSVDRPHLHFGVRDAGTDHAYRDPLDFLGSPPSSSPPVPVVVPKRPVAGGAPAPSPARVRVPAPSGRRAPGGARAPRGGAAHAPVPAPLGNPGGALRGARSGAPGRVPEGAPQGSTAPSGRAEGRGEPREGRAPARSPVAPPEPGPHGSPSGSGAGAEPGPALDIRQPSAPVGAPAGRGPDAGWIAACVGLVVAALALARWDRVSRAAGRGRAAVGAILRPLWRGGH